MIWLKIFFFAKSLMGKPLDSFCFTQIFFFSVSPGPKEVSNQNLLRYEERPFYMILWKQENFGESKLLWAYKFNFERFFCLWAIGSKSCSKLACISYFAPKLPGNQPNSSLLGFLEYTKELRGYQFPIRIIVIWKFIRRFKGFLWDFRGK